MWKDNEKAPVWEFLGWVLLLSVVSEGAILILEPYSVAFMKNHVLTAGYVLYAAIGILFTTPNPMIATYIVLKRHHKIRSVKDFGKLIVYTPSVGKAIAIPAAFGAMALAAAIVNGTRTGSPWFIMIAAFPLMIIGGGVEEIGWRGFLQPALEKKFPFPAATLMVGAIWFCWHLPLWLEPSSNHYGDSLPGFALTIFVWAFAAAAIYRATKSVLACAAYHAFINSIGAVFKWNALFDTFPGKSGMVIYRLVVLTAAVCLWLIADRRERKGRVCAKA